MNSPTKRQIYVLIHGLTPVAMRSTMAGYALSLISKGVDAEDIIMLGYTARNQTGPEIAADVRHELSRKLKAKGMKLVNLERQVDLHIIAHSMGGLMARDLYHGYRGTIKTCLMLGTPNQGINWVEQIPGGATLGRLLFGPKIIDSARTGTEWIKKLPIMYETKVHVITGTKQHTLWNPLSWLCSAFLEGGHDGFVPIRATILSGPNVTRSVAHVDHLAMVTSPEFVNLATDKSLEMSCYLSSSATQSSTQS